MRIILISTLLFLSGCATIENVGQRELKVTTQLKGDQRMVTTATFTWRLP